MVALRSIITTCVVATLVGCSPSPSDLSGSRPADVMVEEVTAGISPAGAVLPDDFYGRALASSLAIVTGYLSQSDLITSEAGESADRIRPWVTPSWYPKEEQGFRYYQETGERTSGVTVFEDAYVQVARVTPEKTLDIALYGCVDTTGVFILRPEHEEPPAEATQWHPGLEEFQGGEQEWEIIEAFYAQDGIRWGDRRAIVFWLVGDSFDSLAIDSSTEWWGAHAC
jgi:hypothetical protein